MLRAALLLLVLSSSLCGCRKDESSFPRVKLEGIIRDEFGGPLDGVKCKLQSALGNHDAVTSDLGSFQMKEILAGEYTFTASKEGYITLSKPIRMGVDPGNVELVLSSGSSFLHLSDSIIQAPHGAGSTNFRLESNVPWQVASSTWLSVNSSQGSGNANLIVNWQASTEDQIRVGFITIISGSLQRAIRVKQDPPIKIMAVTPVHANLLYDTYDSIHIDLNRVATVNTVTASNIFCIHNIKFKVTGKRVSLTYGCAEMGGSYPITISGKLGEEPFALTADANFFERKVRLPGNIDDYVLEPDNGALWAITRFPNKLYRISLPDMTITKELSLPYTPSAVRWNSFAGEVNLFSQRYCVLADVEAGTCNANYLIYVDPVSLETSQSKIPYIPDQSLYGDQVYPYLYPTDLALFNDGTGIIQLSNEYNSRFWRYIDCTENDSTWFGEGHQTSNDIQYQEVLTNFDGTKIYLKKPWGSTAIDVYTKGNPVFETFASPVRGAPNMILAHKKTNLMYHAQLYEQFITDMAGYVSAVSFLDTRYFYSGVDFSYRAGEEEIMYYLGDGIFRVLDYRFAQTRAYISASPILMNIRTTTDGKGMVALRQNNEGNTDLFYFDLNRLLLQQDSRLSSGGRKATSSKFRSDWVK